MPNVGRVKGATGQLGSFEYLETAAYSLNRSLDCENREATELWLGSKTENLR